VRTRDAAELYALLFVSEPFLVRRLLIHEPLSFRCLHCQNGALSVVHLAIVPQKIEVPQIAMQVFLTDVVVDASDPALYKRMAAFRCVRMSRPTSVFFRGMADRCVTRKLRANSAISGELIRHQMRVAIYFLTDRALDGLCGHIGNDVAANLSLPFNDWRESKSRSPFFRSLLGRDNALAES